MQPRLRAVVTVAPVESGCLFRLEDQFLEIKGEHGWPWFQRIRPLLDGEISLTRARDVLGDDHYGLFLRLVESLRRAGMVYDATDDRAHALPDDVTDGGAGTLRRIEAQGTSPRRTFTELRSLRVIVAGENAYVAPLMEACREAGLTPCAMHVLTDGDGEGSSVSVAHAAWRMNVGSLPTPAFRRMLASAAPDHILLLGGGDHLDAALSGMPADAGESRGPAALFKLARYRDAAVAAVLMPGAGMGCAACLAAYYQSQADGVEEPLALDADRGVNIAARLLVQHLVDDRASVRPRTSSYVSEVDLRTFDVQRRVVFPRLECPACGEAAAAAASRHAAVEDHEDHAPAPHEPRQIWTRAEAFYVDRRTGLIAEVAEGRLLQFPCHQSSALRSPASDSRLPWITEVGDDIYDARCAVVRRVVEAYLLERLSSPLSPLLSLKGDALPPHAIVASAAADDELRANALLAAIARYAHERSADWSDVPISDLETGAAADPMLAYLRETGLLSQVRVQRNPSMSSGSLTVVRFARGAQVVSVAAGLEPARLWHAGLRDIWLDATGRDAFGPAWDTRRALRVRACGCPPAAVPDIEQALHTLDLEVLFARVTSPVTAGLDPLLFAHASLWSRHESSEAEPQTRWRGRSLAASLVLLSALPRSPHPNVQTPHVGGPGPLGGRLDGA